jgi:tungstate transport system permease protein
VGGAFVRAFELIFTGDRDIFTIAATSVALALVSTALAGFLGIGAALLLRLKRFPGRRIVLVVLNSLMALPTVVIGLTVYVLISRAGPFGSLGLLFTRPAIVIGQVVLAFPLVASLVYGALSEADETLGETLKTLGVSGARRFLVTIGESGYAILIAIVTGFGRVIGEVGVSMMLGGNIRFRTRTITTAIAMESSKGELQQALALGVILIVIALGVNAVLHAGVRRDR